MIASYVAGDLKVSGYRNWVDHGNRAGLREPGRLREPGSGRPSGLPLDAGGPAKLLAGRPLYGLGAGLDLRMYDVSPDGRRFLMISNQRNGASAAPPQIVVVQNWLEELKRLVPAP